MDRVAEKISEGTEFKAVYPDKLLQEKAESIPSQVRENTRLRTLERVRLTVVVSDDFAFLGLPTGGHVDRNTYLYGEDQTFRDWCMQLFQHYWLEAIEYG
jgi:predicted transcriptional regulator